MQLDAQYWCELYLQTKEQLLTTLYNLGRFQAFGQELINRDVLSSMSNEYMGRLIDESQQLIDGILWKRKENNNDGD